MHTFNSEKQPVAYATTVLHMQPLHNVYSVVSNLPAIKTSDINSCYGHSSWTWWVTEFQVYLLLPMSVFRAGALY